MRIPLDYYRILSVPIKVTSEQLEQAYRDRLLQQPLREYSDRAIKARQELIKHSYQVLSDLEQRASYDAQFMVNMQPKSQEVEGTNNEGEAAVEVREESASIPLANPTIDIPVSQLLGALLLLQELGEYETVLRIGIDLFNQTIARKSSSTDLVLEDTQKDLILSLVLAYLELGREQWHRKEYENAAVSGRMGLDLLSRYDLFPHLQEELELDLHKLRPYRILELISHNPAHSAKRAKGLKLLRSMLIQRGGIEEEGADRSGLSFDRFLRFIQQLRTYLTSAEQQQLFDNKSQSKSAIANYLAVYALLGRGFSLKKPELVLRAQRKLDFLSEKQDVSWEQSITALLLGHTQKAIQKLKDSPDPSQLQQVQQHSMGSSDILPGLCFYGEQWLLQDVVAQFSDLSATDLTLKEYFADRQVQAYLEELAPPAPAKVAKKEIRTQPAVQKIPAKDTKTTKIMSLWRNVFPGETSPVASSQPIAIHTEMANGASTHKRGITATIERGTATKRSAVPNHAYSQSRSDSDKHLSLPLYPKHRAVPPSVVQRGQKHHSIHRRKKRSPATVWKGWLFIIGLMLGVGTIANLGMKLVLSSSKQAVPVQLAIALDKPAVEIPPKPVKPVVAKPKPKLTFKQQSQQVVQSWLTSKSAAFGKEHQIDKLDSILAEPLLTTWRDRAKIYQQENFYREYEHGIVMRSATIDPTDKNRATVEAEVKEVAKHYQNGQLDNAQSYDDNLLVRYQLVRRGEKWLIDRAEVLETL